MFREKVSLFFLFYVSSITQAYIIDFLGGGGGRCPLTPLILPLCVTQLLWEICCIYSLQCILSLPMDAIQHPTNTHPYIWGKLLHSSNAIISLSHEGRATMHPTWEANNKCILCMHAHAWGPHRHSPNLRRVITFIECNYFLVTRRWIHNAPHVRGK